MVASARRCGTNRVLNTRGCTWSGMRRKTTGEDQWVIDISMLLEYPPSAFAAAFSRLCSTMKPLDLASSAYESSLLAIKILSLGIPESLKFWACAAPWFPNLYQDQLYLIGCRKSLPKDNYLFVAQQFKVCIGIVVTRLVINQCQARHRSHSHSGWRHCGNVVIMAGS